jgi:starch phosphorylase
VSDVQIKRLHEYKRQLLNVLNIITIYNELCEDPNAIDRPITFFFGAKAASSYTMAKRIIQLICLLSKEIESQPNIKEKLRVVFLEDYNVTMAEAIIPASEVSQQISMAGKEASGTGCMKFMMNGAITIGTLDGANVEMLERAGSENMFIFGLTSKEVDEYWSRGYDAASYYARDERLMRAISRLSKGFAGESFTDIATYLVSGAGGVADPYMCLADFESYHMTHKKLLDAYADRERFNRMSLMNIAASGYFSADRSIEKYAKNIWGLQKIK